CETRNRPHVPNEMASAPLRSLAALAICGRYATTRKLLHSVNAASVMSANVIPRGILLGRELLVGFERKYPGGSIVSVVQRSFGKSPFRSEAATALRKG